MKIRDSSHTRCSFGSSVIKIVRPISFCRCSGRAHRGRPASQRYLRILSSFRVLSSRSRNRLRSCFGSRRESPSRIATGKIGAKVSPCLDASQRARVASFKKGTVRAWNIFC